MSKQAFYTEALPCESCGKPCETRTPATWDPTLQVGPCCEIDLSEIPEMPVCMDLYRAVMRCTTVGEVADAFDAHRAVCAFCRGDCADQIEHREAA